MGAQLVLGRQGLGSEQVHQHQPQLVRRRAGAALCRPRPHTLHRFSLRLNATLGPGTRLCWSCMSLSQSSLFLPGKLDSL